MDPSLAVLLATIIVPAILGILVIKSMDQQARDRQRKVYRLTFPTELDEERVNAWLRSVSGTLRFTKSRLVGVPTISLELWADERGIAHYIRIPWQYVEYIVPQLRTYGIRVDPERPPERPEWTAGVEVGLSNRSHGLAIYSAADVASSILTSVSNLKEGEQVVIQWVVTPKVPEVLPMNGTAQSHKVSVRHLTEGALATKDEVKERRNKLAEPNFMAALRVASYAPSRTRADHLIANVRHAISQTRGPSTRFYKRMVGRATLNQRIGRSTAPFHFKIQLNVPELTAMIAWPIMSLHIPGLPAARSRSIPPSVEVPRAGRIIGRSNMPGSERPVAIDYKSALMHTHVMGGSGAGKTTLLANMVKQDIDNGFGLVLIENKGDLFHRTLDYIPASRKHDVIVMDVRDTQRPVGFNILQQGRTDLVIDDLTSLFDNLFASRSIWTKEVLYHGLKTIAADPRLTFVDLAALLMPMTADEEEWQDDMFRHAADKELRHFWQRFSNQPRATQDRIASPVLDRIWTFNARPEIRHIIGQSQSAFQMADVVRNNKILLVNLEGLSNETANLTATLMVQALWSAVRFNPSDRPTFLYLDEASSLQNLPVDTEDMLVKARSFGLGITVAHQHLNQLTPAFREAIMANTYSKVVFQSSSADGRTFTAELGQAVSDQDFINLGMYEAIARVGTPLGKSAPFTMTTYQPAKGYGLASEIIARSREQYGRPAAEVAADIEARRRAVHVPKTRRRPITKDDAWD